MLTSLVELAALLRRGGLRVSTSEVIDAVRALDAVGLARGDVHAALRATLVKRASDGPIFDELLRLHLAQTAEATTVGIDLLTAAGIDPERAHELLAALGAAVAGLGPLARLGAGGATPELPGLLRGAGAQVGLDRIETPLQIGPFGFRMLDALGARDAATAVQDAVDRTAASMGASPGETAVLRELVVGNFDRLRQAVRGFVDGALRRQRPDLPRRMAAATLADRPLAQLSPQELALLAAEVDRLAARLSRRVRHRQRRPRRGRLDVSRTLRASLAAGGVPFEVRFHRRPRRPPRLVVLCDISDSVRAVARFFLHLVYALQERWQRIDTFAFVADIGELTDLFARTEVHRAVELALGGAVVSPWASSDYGHALEQFHARYAGRVGSRTTVIVLGDARSNYQPPRAALLADLRRRARRVLWLNPEPSGAWGWGDSAMAAYAAHCDRVFTVWNLASLRVAVEEIAT
jgi:uncharacterized protein